MDYKLTKAEFNKLPFIGKGVEGVVKKYGNLALKRFYDDSFKDRINIQYGIKNDNIILPISKLYIENEYVGYVTKYIDGTNDVTKLNEIKNLTKLIKKLERSVIELSNHKLLLSDLIIKNSLFSNNGIYLIDTSRYEYLPNLSIEDIIIKNKKELNAFLSILLFYSHENIRGITLKEILELLCLSEMYDELSKGKGSYSNVLEEMYDTLNVTSIDEARKKINVMRKPK